ncbi:hypothetical protein D9611_012341 [Ephemerocybe angulata]|uniref:Integrase catalytic domain-containing protein n=1 Tax=Ephemerocybe angulata TaxID=980116 RepID=A0A8H5FKF9_9AGAR|nr:hypothetical protein D9611_012341 [Tulosesus angulatus]
MTSASYLPRLLDKAQGLIDDGKFFLSSIPNVDSDVGRGISRQLSSARGILSDVDDYSLLTKRELQEVVGLIDTVLKPLCTFLVGNPGESQLPQSPRIYTGKPGRPKYDLDLRRAIQLHEMGNTWEDVGKAMGVKRITLYRYLEAAGLSTERIPYADLSDDDLDTKVAAINQLHPLSGSVIVRGHLLAQGLKVQLQRVRDSLRRVDEDGVLLRTRTTTYRRVYRVRGSNALWHQDGNEKLKPWGFYIHGCVDGHSRLIIYLVCTNNKRSKTVGECFSNAVVRYGWPSRVRGDYGTENNEIERKMVERWGLAHRAYLRGRSVHNVRIERLWRDVRRDSLERFRQLFLTMEKEHLLDPDSPIHLVSLYLVYHPRIQDSLNETITSWNNHSLRTERYKTPLALYELSRETAINAGYWNSDVGDRPEDVNDDYGVEGECASEKEAEEEPVAPRSDHFASLEEEIEAGIVITDDEFIAEAREAVSDMDLGQDDGSWGIDLYCDVLLRLTAHFGVGMD